MKKSKMMICAAFALAVLSGCGAANTPEYQTISPQEAQKMMDAGNVTILDVRTQDEYNEGHIKDAILLPHTEITAQAASVLPDKQQTILVYCRSGVRAATASQALADMGYTKVYNFGGIMSWTGDVVQ